VKADSLFANRYFLVVDDEAFQRDMARRFLSQAGAEAVVEAADGQAAIDMILRYDMAFDAVVTDFKMAQMNGLALLKAIRTGAHGLKRNMPVIMLTAHSDSQLVAAALALDADGFVVKPVSREGLVQRVQRALQKTIALSSMEHYHTISLTPAVVPAREASGAVTELASLPPSTNASGIWKRGETPPAPPKPVKPLSATESTASAAPGKSASPREALMAKARTMDLDEVPPGSVLAQDLYGDGAKLLLLGIETVLTTALLHRLQDLRLLHKTLSRILVVVPEPTG